MKIKLLFLSMFFLSFSCKQESKQSLEEVLASDDVEVIKTYKGNLENKQKSLEEQIVLLDKELSKRIPEKNIPNVTVKTLQEQQFDHYIELQGNVETKQNIVLFSEYVGIIKNVYVQPGTAVSKGQLLARIDDGGLSQQLEQLKIQRDLAKTTFERQSRLWQEKIGSELQYLQSKTSYESLEQSIKQVQKTFSKTEIRAPFNGVIDDVLTDQGNFVSPGTVPVFRLVNLKNMFISTDVPERYLKTITKGKDVLVSISTIGVQMKAKVNQVSQYIDPQNRTFKVEVTLQNKDGLVKPNLTAKLKINDYTNPKALLIPQNLISENVKGDQYVYLLQTDGEGKSKALKKFIETGISKGDFTEVISHLQPGDQLISEGARQVIDGQTVRVLKQE